MPANRTAGHRRILAAAIVALLYWGAGKASLLLLHGHHIVNIGIFASEGIALAFALYYGPTMAAGIFVGQLLLALSNGIPPIPSAAIATTNATEALIAVYLFRRFRLRILLRTFRDVIGLGLMIVLVLQPLSALLSTGTLLLTHQISGATYFQSLFSWWFGNVMGQLLFTPFVLLLLLHHRRVRLVNFVLWGLGLGLGLYVLEIVLDIRSLLLLMSITIPAAIWIVARRTITCGMLFAVWVSVISAYSVYLGVGAFSRSSTLDNVIDFNLFVLAHIVTVFTASILFEQHRKLEQTLRHTIGKETEKNRRQQLMMIQQSRLAQMGEMIAMIAHQWRQPLNNLSLVNQLLISRYRQNRLDDAMMAYFKEHSRQYIQHMSSTIDDFRDFFRSEKESELFALNDVLDRVLGITQAIYANHHIQIVFHAAATHTLYGHPNDLGQALLNIIQNAKDALMDSAVTPKEIHIALTEDTTHITIHISDNAGGIPEAILEQIFDPYFSTKENKNGTGLGLYMARMIIHEKFNGTIHAQNTDHGAYFTITLPKQNTRQPPSTHS